MMDDTLMEQVFSERDPKDVSGQRDEVGGGSRRWVHGGERGVEREERRVGGCRTEGCG